MGKGYTFNKQSVQRIKKSVEFTEGFSQPNTQRIGPSGSPLGFWAVILFQGESHPKRYSWSQLIAQPFDDPMVLNTQKPYLLEGTEDTYPAFEIWGSEHVLPNSIVWLYPAITEEYYIFEYHPGSVIAKVGEDDIDEATGDGPRSVIAANLTLYRWEEDELVDAEVEFEATNWVKDKIKAETFVLCTYSVQDRRWYITSADCKGPDDEEEA